MKTDIGEFLSALRKSKGLTQQEVANLLGVSNKTVSSWETGASCPDISMLPAIAELYGVTCDELLRGERISAQEPQERIQEKRRKSLARLLAGYRNNASAAWWICGALDAAAVIGTLLIGCAATESLIGFFVGLIFLIGSALLCILQTKHLRLKVLQDDFDSREIDAFCRTLSRGRSVTLILLAASFGFIFPHVFIPVHAGLRLAYAFGYGALGAAVCAVVALSVWAIARAAAKSYRRDEVLFRCKLRYEAIPAILLAVLGSAAVIVTSVVAAAWNPPFNYSSVHLITSDYESLAQTLEGSDTDIGKYEYALDTDAPKTTATEEMLKNPITAETRFKSCTVFKAVCHFPEFPEEYANCYQTIEFTDQGVQITVDMLSFTLENGAIISVPVINPEYQCESLSATLSPALNVSADNADGETVYQIVLQGNSPPFYATEYMRKASVNITVSICVSAGVWILAIGIYLAVYLPRRKKLLFARQDTDETLSDLPEEKENSR